uniref:RNA pseudouridylate synthase n=1 Tax=uncultured delta proteobacterium DeepAnt-32C6 TaxID=357895 RepID=Q2I6L3_9DELT|nr:RNA pseudouridylate synthase [uncultured delta proteobacterium DeepAnt-32C6]
MAVHAAGPVDPEAPDLMTWARTHFDAPGLAPAHRIDKATSGLLLCSPDPRVRARVGHWLAQGQVHKEYRALVFGHTHRSGRIDRPLMDRRRGRRLDACTRFRRLATASQLSYLAVYPETGRKHQIRRHLRGLGHAIVGDTRYGPTHQRPLPGCPGRLWLHLRQLELPEGLTFEAPLPPALVAHLERLGIADTQPSKD